MNISVNETPTLEGHVNADGTKHYLPIWKIEVYGSEISDDFRDQNFGVDEVCEIVKASEEEICRAIERIIHKHARPYLKGRYGCGFVDAEVDLEADGRNGYIQYVRSESFECSLALDRFELNELPPEYDGFGYDFCNYGDDIYTEAVDLGLVCDWDGPFTFNVTDWEAYDRYIAARVRAEYGYELREA